MFFKPKIDPACPDYWTVTLHLLSGKVDEVQVVSQVFEEKFVQFVTKDDTRIIYVLENVVSLAFDKAYTTITERRAKNG